MTSNQALNPSLINVDVLKLPVSFAVANDALSLMNSDQSESIQNGFVDYQPHFSVTNVLTQLSNLVHNNRTIHTFGARRSARLSVRRRR